MTLIASVIIFDFWNLCYCQSLLIRLIGNSRHYFKWGTYRLKKKKQWLQESQLMRNTVYAFSNGFSHIWAITIILVEMTSFHLIFFWCFSLKLKWIFFCVFLCHFSGPNEKSTDDMWNRELVGKQEAVPGSIPRRWCVPARELPASIQHFNTCDLRKFRHFGR